MMGLIGALTPYGRSVLQVVPSVKETPGPWVPSGLDCGLLGPLWGLLGF